MQPPSPAFNHPWASHEDGEGDVVKTLEGIGKAFVISGESAQAGCPGEAAFDDPPSWQEDEAAFCHRVLDDFESAPMLLSGFVGVRASVALIDVGTLDRVAGHLLHLGCERGDLLAVALVDWHYGQRRQVTERVYRDVNLAALAACPLAHDRLHTPPPNFETASIDPAPHLLIHRGPGWKIVG